MSAKKKLLLLIDDKPETDGFKEYFDLPDREIMLFIRSKLYKFCLRKGSLILVDVQMPVWMVTSLLRLLRVIQILSLFPPIFVTAISNEQKYFMKDSMI
jgi:CheY-like chemotaxis protein